MKNRRETYKKDLAAIIENYGMLADGRTLRLDLQDLAVICPRPHLQKRSYSGLVSYIQRAYGTTLEILSQANSNHE